MHERWLRPNHRAVGPLLVLPALLTAGSAGFLAFALYRGSGWPILAAITVPLVVGAMTLAVLVRWTTLPRLAYHEGHLLVFLDSLTPQRVPIETVECFFRGQGDALLPGMTAAPVRTATIVVRLAEAAPSWHQRDVRPTFGQWAGGYITLRGTWCEPITPELLRELNARLVAAHRAVRQCEHACAPGGCGS